MKPTDVLRKEHGLIERVLISLATAADQIEAGKAVEAEEKAVTFLRSFVDHCHHGKEEDRLFPLLQSKGIGSGPTDIGVLLDEHEQGRTFVRGIENSIGGCEKKEAAATITLCGCIRQYRQLLVQHIRKENDSLFPAADAALSQTEQEEMLRSFEEFERGEIGEGVHEQLTTLAEELIGKWADLGVEAEYAHRLHAH